MNKQGRDVFGLRQDNYRYGRIIIMGSPNNGTGRNHERRRFMRLIHCFDVLCMLTYGSILLKYFFVVI